jgi:hypothetical protein
MTDAETGYGLFKLLMGLVGGLALFLYGMEQMAGALKAIAGSRMRTVLASLTSNRFMGVVTGALVTATIQSSTVTTVLVVGFVSAGLMTLSQSIGVIMEPTSAPPSRSRSSPSTSPSTPCCWWPSASPFPSWAGATA